MKNKKIDISIKRYNSFSSYMKKKYNKKLIKIPINAGFTCPNIDGSKARGGCIYCSKEGSGDFAGNPKDDLIKQFYSIKERMNKKWKNGVYMPYFQAFSNTYAPLSVLKESYESLLFLDDVVGLDIATRPDCLEDDVINYLGELAKIKDIWIDLGLQSIHDKSAKLINRAHDFNDFLLAVEKLNKVGINISVHIINGLPKENEKMMLETVRELNNLPINAIKIHFLLILKNTKLERWFLEKRYKPIDKDFYIDILCKQIEILRPDILVQRLTADAKREDIIAPRWGIKKFELLNEIDYKLEERNIIQGSLC